MKKIILFLIGVVTLGTTSCSDMLDSDSERQLFDPEMNAKTDSIYYALGILQGMQQLADQYMFQGELRGDLVDVTEYTDKNLKELASFAAFESNKYDSAYVYYRIINNCNYYIAHRDTTLRTGASYVVMPEYVAVKAIRAWTYMQLARVYGKVPFYTQPLTQISQINDGNFPKLNMKEITDRLAPDLEQYCQYNNKGEYMGYVTPNFGNVAPSSIIPSALFIPAEVILGEMYLETGQYDKAARHYINYLTELSQPSHSAFLQSYSMGDIRNRDKSMLLPSDFNVFSYVNSTSWQNIFTGLSDCITYIPMAPNNRSGITTKIPLAYGYDYYSNSSSYVDEIQIVPSESLINLSESQAYYYKSTESDPTNTIVSYTGIGDTRYNAVSRQEEDDETAKTTTWITKNRYARVILYRTTTVWLHLAEALNRLGMYDVAFAILKDGINKYLIKSTEEGGPQYISDASKAALQTTYPLLSEANIAKFSEPENCVGVHMHGAGMTHDYTGAVYSPGLSPYQLDTIVGLKFKELEAAGLVVGATPQDTINAVEDILCDEYALEFAFEGCRWFDLMRLARHKNDENPYGENRFGSKWLLEKLAYKKPQSLTEEPETWYLPFK